MKNINNEIFKVHTNKYNQICSYIFKLIKVKVNYINLLT